MKKEVEKVMSRPFVSDLIELADTKIWSCTIACRMCGKVIRGTGETEDEARQDMAARLIEHTMGHVRAPH